MKRKTPAIICAREIVCATVMILGLLVPSAFAQQNNTIIWTSQETQTLNKTTLETGSTDILKMGIGYNAKHLFIDTVRQDLYWLGGREIRRISLDGSQPVILFDQIPFGIIGGFTVDLQNRYMYWSESDSSRIKRLKIGSDTPETVIEGEVTLDFPGNLAIHDDLLYIEQDGVMTANLDGSDLQVLIDGYPRTMSITVDGAGQKVYWATRDDNGLILRANLDGSEVETIIQTRNPEAISIDPKNDKLNWVSVWSQRSLMQSDLDGANPDTVFKGNNDIADTESGSDGTLYWSKDKTGRSFGTGVIWSKSSENIREFLTEMEIADLIVDEENQSVFWLEYIGAEAIMSADLSLQNADTVVKNQSFNNLSKFALDPGNKRLYYGSGTSISATDYQGNTTDSLASYVGSLSGLAVYPSANQVYWMDNGSTSFGNLKRTNYETGKTETLISQSLNFGRSLKIDQGNGQLYWATGSSFSGEVGIKTAGADAGNQRLLYSQQNEEIPQSISLESDQNALYFTEYASGIIYHIDLENEESSIALENIRMPAALDVYDQTSTGIKNTTISSVDDYHLEANYPNPFNPSTTIRYRINQAGEVRLAVFDLLGRKVAQLVNERQAAGQYSLQFDASGLASGMYVYLLKTDKFTEMRKMLLMK